MSDESVSAKRTRRSFIANVANVARPSGWPVLPAGALYGLAGDFVRAIQPHSEADPAAILIQFLAAAGNMFGPGPHCMVAHTRHPLLIYPVLTGETSKGRKGTSLGHIEWLFGQVDAVWARDRVTSGLSSSEGLICEVRDGAEPPNDRRLLIVQGEFASVLRVMRRDGNTLSSTLRDAWDSGNLRTLVKTSPLRATGAHITVIGHITRAELLHYLSDTEAHNGFANRFLWVCTQRTKFLPEGGCVPNSELSNLRARLAEVHSWVASQVEFEIKRDDSARQLWACEYRRISEGLPGLLGAATGRAEAQVLRMSAILAVLDCSAIVRVAHLEAALAIWEYCLTSASYIFGRASGDPVAEAIRRALIETKKGLTRTQIRDLFNRHRSTEEIEYALKSLSALGLASCKHVSTSGRDTQVWTATEAT